MFNALRDSLELLRDQVWFFRFVVIIGVICVYRTLLHYVLRSNHCANPFCSKCVSSGSLQGRAIAAVKKNSSDDDDSLSSIIHHNLLQHERWCHRSDEKPTVYYHRGLSSETKTLPDEEILLDHYDEIRQEMFKFAQENHSNESNRFYLFETGEENGTNCLKFPKLFEILHLLPNAICIQHPHCLFGNCFVTRLTSDKSEEKENSFGLSNCSLRLNFGVICDDQSSAYVLLHGQKRLPIKTKSLVLYNEALQHSIRNPAEKQQIFLTIDFWHPDLSKEMRKELAKVFHTDLA